jgi:major capsid protein Gp23
MFDQMTPEMLIEKWSNVDSKLSVHTIPDYHQRYTTARILENIERRDKNSNPFAILNETVPTSVAPTSQATGQFSPISMAIGRRVMPALFAFNCVGVQPMSGPVGLAYAMRFKYAGQAQEAGWEDMDLWNTFTGNLSGTSAAAGSGDTGTGVPTATAEAWDINSTTSPTPQLVWGMEQVAITAKTRKIAANVSLELIQDMKAMHGLDPKRELVERLQFEIRANKDREILYNMKVQAVTTANGGEAVTTWQTSASDGRWQQEKFATIANVIIQKGNVIGDSTKLNSANFVVVSSRVASVLQAAQPFFMGNTVTADNSNAMAEIGTLNGRMKVYLDRFARNDYALLGLKDGNGQNGCGVVYSPYVIGLESEATNPGNFSPNVGVMDRYAITNSLMGAGRYYRMINFANLSSILQA